MKIILEFLIVFLVLALALFLEMERALSLGGVNPNLVLVALVLLIFYFSRFGTAFFLFAVSFTIILSFFWMPFWWSKVMVLGVLALGIYFVRDRFTGNDLINVGMVIAALTLLFYLIFNVFNISGVPWVSILGEMFYNMTLGVAGAILISFLERKYEK